MLWLGIQETIPPSWLLQTALMRERSLDIPQLNMPCFVDFQVRTASFRTQTEEDLLVIQGAGTQREWGRETVEGYQISEITKIKKKKQWVGHYWLLWFAVDQIGDSEHPFIDC